jgi:hypothetical protein
MTTTTTTPTTIDAHCPDCGAPFVIDEHAEAGVLWFCPNPGQMPTLETRRRPAIVAFCTGCEFSLELRRTV